MIRCLYIMSLILISLNISCSHREKSIYRYEDIVTGYDYNYFIQMPGDNPIVQVVSYNPDSMSYADIYAYFHGKISPVDIDSIFTNRIAGLSITHTKYEFGMDLENKRAANTNLYLQIHKYPFCEVHSYEWEIKDPKSFLNIYYINGWRDEQIPVYATWIGFQQ